MSNETTDPDPDRGKHGHFVAGNRVAGRQSMLTPRRHKQIIELLGTGVSLRTAAHSVAIHERTLRKFLARGEAHREANERTPFSRLYVAACRARAKVKAQLYGVIKQAATEGVEGERTVKIIKRVPVTMANGETTYQDQVTVNTETTREAPDWRAAARLAEAIDQSRFGPNHRVDVRGRLRHDHRAAVMSDEDRAVAQRIIASRLGPRPVDDGGQGRPKLPPGAEVDTQAVGASDATRANDGGLGPSDDDGSHEKEAESSRRQVAISRANDGDPDLTRADRIRQFYDDVGGRAGG